MKRIAWILLSLLAAEVVVGLLLPSTQAYLIVGSYGAAWSWMMLLVVRKIRDRPAGKHDDKLRGRRG